MKKQALILFFFYVNFCLSYAQEIKGILIEKNTLIPIAFASITLKGDTKNIFGAMTNEKGEFTITINNQTSQLTFSHINYKDKTITVVELSKNQKIELEVNIELLKEVEITSLPAKKLLKDAITNSSKSTEKNIVLNTYAREVTKINDEYKNISDAMIDYYISKKNGKSRLVVNQSRAFIKDTNKLKHSLSIYDVRKFVKNAYDFSFFDKISNEKNYTLKVYNRTDDEGKSCKYIKIIPKKEVQELLYEGYIVIDSETNRITETKIYTSNEHLKFAKYYNLILFEMRLDYILEWTKFKTIGDKYILLYNKDNYEFSFNMKDKTEEVTKLNAYCDIFVQGFVENVEVPEKTYQKKSIFEAGTNFKDDYWLKVKSYPLTKDELNFINSFPEAK